MPQEIVNITFRCGHTVTYVETSNVWIRQMRSQAMRRSCDTCIVGSRAEAQSSCRNALYMSMQRRIHDWAFPTWQWIFPPTCDACGQPLESCVCTRAIVDVRDAIRELEMTIPDVNWGEMRAILDSVEGMTGATTDI